MASTRFREKTLASLAHGDWIDDRYPNLVFRVGERTRTWMLRLPRRPDGSRPGRKLGRFPDLGLADALRLYQAERGRLARGEPNPNLEERIAELEAELQALKRAAGKLVSVRELVERFLADYVPKSGQPLTPDIHRRRTQIFEARVLPLWGDRDAGSLTDTEIQELVASIQRATPAAANNLFKLLKTMYTWAVRQKILAVNPTAGLSKPVRDNQRTRVLAPEEIRAFWRACAQIKPPRGEVLRLTLLTWQRRAEVTGLPWLEIQGDWWTLSDHRSKNRDPNFVYLASQARAILDRQRQRHAESRFVFRGFLSEDRPISKHLATFACQQLSQQLLAQGEVSQTFTVHDLRRTAATTGRSIGIDRRVVEQILNHRSNSVTDIYDRYAMKPEIQAALTTWDGYITDLTRGA